MAGEYFAELSPLKKLRKFDEKIDFLHSRFYFKDSLSL